MPKKTKKPDYVSYVGPAAQYDFMGATQFRLLSTMGLREKHKVLDFGCGSLRAGRLLMPFLEKECYFGIEPNYHLVEEGIEANLGQGIVALKKPTFATNSDFAVPFQDTKFDFIVAQSIFSHTGIELVRKGLKSFHDALGEKGVVLATFVEGNTDHAGSDWVYPGTVFFRPSTVERLAREAGLHCRRLRWFHPRQTWYIMTKNPKMLPSWWERMTLTGSIINDPRFSRTAKRRFLIRKLSRKYKLANWLFKPFEKSSGKPQRTE